MERRRRRPLWRDGGLSTTGTRERGRVVVQRDPVVWLPGRRHLSGRL